jgi:hypothetical protein
MVDFNPNTPTSKLNYPTDYKLESLALFAPGFSGALDLLPHMVELNYFEDIYNNTISGNVVISDSVGILNFASLGGTEFIVVRFRKSDDLPISVDRVFRVFSVSDRRFDLSNNHEIYKIEFCSEEYLLSEQYRISKSYKGQKVSDMVADICNTYLKIGGTGKKQLYVDDTVGTYDFVLPNKKPIETINWLANYALPASGTPGADILFFENRIGYFFTSLQHMYKTDAVLSFLYNPKNIANDVFAKMTSVLKFEVLNYVDTLEAMNRGTFANRVISVDPIRRKKTTTDFNYNEYYKKSTTLNGSPVTNNYKNRHGKQLFDTPPKDMEAGVLRMMITNMGQQTDATYIKNKPGSVSNDYRVEQYLPNRVSQLSLANYNRLKLTVPGNSSIFAGMCINFTASSMNQMNEKGSRPIDPYLSGKYLISAVRHIITPISYISVIEICKDSGIMNYSGVDPNSSSWNGFVTGNQNNNN